MIQRRDILVSFALFGVTFAVYLLTLAPSFTFADTAELALAASTGGVAHPPGFPLYLVLGGLFSGLPLGDEVAYRLNVFSALAAALTIPVIFLILRVSLAPGKVERPGQSGGDAWIPGYVAPASGAILFGFSLTFWRQATITEVYTLNMLMSALVIFFGFLGVRMARERRERTWVLVAFGVAAGLGTGNHLTLPWMIPGIGLALLLARWRGPGRVLWRLLVPIAAGVLAGVAAYAVLPIRAGSDPLMNWGDPDLWERFWRHVTAWQFRVIISVKWATISKQLGVFLQTCAAEMGFLPLLLIPAGIARLVRRDRLVLFGLALSFLLPLAWALCYDIAEDQETYFMIPFMVMSIFMGQGALFVLEAAADRFPGRGPRIGAGAAILVLAASPLILNYSSADRSRQTEARAYGMDLLESVQPDAIVLTRNWNLYAPTLYLQHIDGLRKDVDVVDANLLRYSWYMPYLEQSAPRVLTGLDRRIVIFRQLQARWERGQFERQEEHDRIRGLYEEMIGEMVKQAWRGGRPVYATRDMIRELEGVVLGGRGIEFVAVPETLAFRILPASQSISLPELRFRNTWERESWDPISRKARSDYFLLWLNRGAHHEAYGEVEEALEALGRAKAISPDNEKVREALARLRGKSLGPGR